MASMESDRLIQSATDFRDSSLALSTKPTDFCPNFTESGALPQTWSGGHERVN
jgi:hypothetical protein